MKKMWTGLFLASFVLWFIFKKDQPEEQTIADTHEVNVIEEVIPKITMPKSKIINKKNIAKLEKIGEVFNDKTISIPKEKKDKIKKEREIFDKRKTLTNLTELLEKSFFDRQNSIDDIKSIQNKIAQIKKELNIRINNTEKWDPRLVYYLMIQESYNYNELNSIKKLEDNGISKDELAYIKEVTKKKDFSERIKNFKTDQDPSRKIAAYVPSRDRDEFIEDDYTSGPSLEDKLIEMKYSADEIEEMQKGFSY